MSYTFEDQSGMAASGEFGDLGLVMQDFVSNDLSSHHHHHQQHSHSNKYSLPHVGSKRTANNAGLDVYQHHATPSSIPSRDANSLMKSEGASSDDELVMNVESQQSGNHLGKNKPAELSNGKKTKGRVKIKMEFIDNKLRRYTTFSKRKTGIMKKAYELSTLTGTQVMLLVASETGHVYTFATRKLQPMITSEAGKALIQTCLNSPDIPASPQELSHDQRMCATGFEETELSYNIGEDENSKDGRLSSSSPEPSSNMSEPESPSINDIMDHVENEYVSRKAQSAISNRSNRRQPTPLTSASQVPEMPNLRNSYVSAQLSSLQPMQAFSSQHGNYCDGETSRNETPSPKVPSTIRPTISHRLSSKPSVVSVPSVVSPGDNSVFSSISEDATNSSSANILPTTALPMSIIQGSSSSQSGTTTTLSSPLAATLPSAVMYHTPQGVVYATPTSATLPDGSNVILNFAATPQPAPGTVGISADQIQGAPAQQYITIPVPMSLTSQQHLLPAISPAMLQHHVENLAKTEASIRKSSSKK